MTPRNITSPVVIPQGRSVSSRRRLDTARQQAHKWIAPSRRVVVYGSAAGAGAGDAIAGAAGCGDAGFAGCTAGTRCAHTRPVAATNTAAMTPFSTLSARQLAFAPGAAGSRIRAERMLSHAVNRNHQFG